ncbi:hypothetical protein [Pontibacter anaerobius]|uniref:Uncharacterized protein n=1 Tax=Pontibacter anaerobius TaxID=2993940 RepID=A0ABT3RBE3_9BACT|nr:hypothetical protein [Pontibacter anaerobius]MCX2739181.1 hypothetical protein [Pontibacter anaerobius]
MPLFRGLYFVFPGDALNLYEQGSKYKLSLKFTRYIATPWPIHPKAF